ncbi:uncharacterized protein IL334_002626 [Kwoniella shivajii]|uniref:F-box domain-containing protein n=1 Tax=Kwoniella shivajii TaxID=564305 RepID=A0ABZ1CV87_9TREE|nr:hypothetical protein IL334_002626 [Kwoniella shivajii]
MSLTHADSPTMKTSVPSPSPAARPRLPPRTSRSAHPAAIGDIKLLVETDGRATPRGAPSTSQPITARTLTQVNSPLCHMPAETSTQGYPSVSSESWIADEPQPHNGFPEIYSEPTNWDDPVTEHDWELRTETANGVEDENSPLAALERHYLRQITHYKNLLVRSQSASSSSLHDLHSQLHVLKSRYHGLEIEHAQCAEKEMTSRQEVASEKRIVNEMKNGLHGTIRDMGRDERVQLLGLVVESCHPSDISAQIALLEKYRRSRFDILSRLDEGILVDVLGLLEVEDILQLRKVSQGYLDLTKVEPLWKHFCEQLEWREWDGKVGLASLQVPPPYGWEVLYRNLWRRERNWNAGLAQKVILLKGHTNYVTSLSLRGDTLISGSYDETIRVWYLPSLTTIHPSSIPDPLVIPAKSVSCLDYYPPAGVFVAGYHDVGRVQVWKRKGNNWDMMHTLSGHLHGIRAVALNENHLVSAGADKALVVWSWRTGEKIVRFGQQTNICVGIQLVHDQIVAITVDGVIRAFSIKKREMIAQFKISDLGRTLGKSEKEMEWKSRLKAVGSGQGGSGMINWFEGQGRWMTCANRDMIIRLSWEEIEEFVSSVAYASAGQDAPSTPSPADTKTKTVLSASRARSGSPVSITTPTRARQRTASSVMPTLSSKKPTPSMNPEAMSQSMSSPLQYRSTQTTSQSITSISSAKGMVRSGSESATPTSLRNKGRPSPGSSSGPIKQASSPAYPLISPNRQLPNPILPCKDTTLKGLQKRIVPLLTTAPRILEIINASDIEKGVVDARRSRIVTSTRFAARSGADRHLYIGVPARSRDEMRLTEMKSVGGAWKDQSKGLNLQTPGKNLMSLVLDQEKFVYGCTDGSIVLVGFLGDAYGTDHKKS